jgi:hypothetical protein
MIAVLFLVGINISCAYTGQPSSEISLQEYYLYRGDYCTQLLSRSFLNDSVFVDQLFGDSGRTILRTDTFMKKNADWHYFSKGNYYPFFSPDMFTARQKIKMYYEADTSAYGFFDQIEILKPIGRDTFNGDSVYLYTRYFDSPVSNVDVYGEIYYFDPAVGFILRREDYCGDLKLIKIDSVPEGWQLKPE